VANFGKYVHAHGYHLVVDLSLKNFVSNVQSHRFQLSKELLDSQRSCLSRKYSSAGRSAYHQW